MVNKLLFHVAKVFLALVTSFILPIVILPVIILVMAMAYSSAKMDLHLPLSIGNKCMDSPSTAPVLLYPQAMHRFPDFWFPSVAFMAAVNHWFTVLAHCELITAYQPRTNSTSTKPRVSVTQTWLCFKTRGKTLLWHHAIAGSSFSLSGAKFKIQKFIC